MKSKRRILLSGSTSFLGSKFVQEYKNKHQILGFSLTDVSNPIDLLDTKALQVVYDTFKPDIIVHLAAVVDNDASKVKEPNIKGTKNLVEIAKAKNTPIVYMSSESVYGGKENIGNYAETDEYKPRSVYGETKVESEKLIRSSGLNYMMLRGHRFVGINSMHSKPKQFSDTLKSLINGQSVHLDPIKLFKPCLINHLCHIIDCYVENDMNKKIIMNVGVDYAITYYDFIVDVVNELDLDSRLVLNDGEEKGWPANSTLSLDLLNSSIYPKITYRELLEILKNDWVKSKER